MSWQSCARSPVGSARDRRMTILATLRALAGGASGVAGVLGSCRLESGNVDSFGIEAIGDAFRRAPFADADTAEAVAAPGHLALFGGAEAIVADLVGDHIARLWRIGEADPGTPEPAVGVAFDTDLRQARADVFVAGTDHPALDPAALDRVVELGRGLVHVPAPGLASFRARAFAIRAFGDVHGGCVLFAVHALAAGPVRAPLLSFAAARWNGADARIVHDRWRARAALVRIAT